MKKLLISISLCCLTVFFLFPGCAQEETSESPLLAHADDTEVNYESPVLSLSNFSSAVNAEGEEIRWFSKADNPFVGSDPEDLIFTLEGNMEHKIITKEEGSVLLEVPFSKSFTVYSIYHHFPEEVSAQNLSDGNKWGKILAYSYFFLDSEGFDAGQAGSFHTSRSVSGDWSKAVYHCNNVVELYGELAEVTIRFRIDKPFISGLEFDVYDLTGNGKDHVIAALVDGEIKTEGMVGNYTVTHYNRVGDKGTEILMEYDETGKLLSTREK